MQYSLEEQFARFFPDKHIRPFAYLLMQRLQEGHICMAVDDQEVNTPLGNACLQMLNKADKSMISEDNKPAPFVFANGFLYLHRYYQYETRIIKNLQQRMESARNHQVDYAEKIAVQKNLILEILGANNPLNNLNEDEKIDWQLIGVLRAMMNDFSIITGGPGTGKTTTLAKFLRLLYAIEPDSKVAIAAPTGKASMRMMDSLLARAKAENFPEATIQKIEALKPHTLHRLLGYIPNSIYFKHHETNTLAYDWVVIDEASMIDLPMFAKLLSACHSSTRILLLGDKDQLASVEAGSLLSDLCISAGTLNRFSSVENNWLNTYIKDLNRQLPDHYASTQSTPLSSCITELRHSRRFEQQSDVGQLGLAIICGETEKAFSILQDEHRPNVMMNDHKNEKALKDFVMGYIDFMEEPVMEKAMEKLNQLRVLATVREGRYGLYTLNRKIESILHNERPDLIRPTASFYHNRPIIITKNNYELDLYNGDVGIVRMDEEKKKLQVYFEPNKVGEDIRSFSPASLSDCETVFAMTIHKSQGSEFDRVMVVLPEQADNRLLTRELIYTGVTRAKKEAIISGTADCLQAGIYRQVVRISGIHQRMKL